MKFQVFLDEFQPSTLISDAVFELHDFVVAIIAWFCDPLLQIQGAAFWFLNFITESPD